MAASAALEPLGALCARALRGSWRAAAREPTLSVAELERLVPVALESGLSGLLWRVARQRPDLAGSPAGRRLREAALRHVLQAGVHERRLPVTLGVAAGAGVDLARECLLLKGPTIAERYPERGLRPFGDVDLAVPPGRVRALDIALAARPIDDDWVPVDTYHRFLRADGTPLTALIARGRPRRCGDFTVTTLGEEDTLRLAAVHYVVSGGWKLLALGDVALLLESAGDLDWDLVLGGDPHRRSWVVLAAGLAQRLLGADLTATPLRDAERTLPDWAVRRVVWHFGRFPGLGGVQAALARATDARDAARAVRDHCLPDPLQAATRFRRPIRSRPPWGWQLLDTPDRVRRVRGHYRLARSH